MIRVGDPQFLYMAEQEKKHKAAIARHERDRIINRVVEEVKDKYAGTAISQDELGEIMNKCGLDEVSQSEWAYMLREIAR